MAKTRAFGRCTAALANVSFFKSRLLFLRSLPVEPSARLELGLVTLEQPADAAYAFVVYAEAPAQELASLPEDADVTLLHLLFESVQRFLSDALGSAAGSMVYEQSIEAISSVKSSTSVPTGGCYSRAPR